MTISELLHSVSKEAVLASLAMTYYGEGEDPKGYSEAWDILLDMQPKTTTMSCVLEQYRNPDWGIDVSGLDSKDNVRYAIEFTDWSEWLSMPVIAPEGMSEVEQLTHILYELTWGGYTPSLQDEANELIEDRLDEIEEIINEPPTLN